VDKALTRAESLAARFTPAVGKAPYSDVDEAEGHSPEASPAVE
jgi:hypothetical protein